MSATSLSEQVSVSVNSLDSARPVTLSVPEPVFSSESSASETTSPVAVSDTSRVTVAQASASPR